MNENNVSTGIVLGRSKLGEESFSYTNKKPQNKVRMGVVVDDELPPGICFLSRSTSGCPKGYTKVTGVANKYMSVTSTDGGTSTAAGSTNHRHQGPTCTSNSNVPSDNLTSCDSDYTGYTTPTITYPALKYLLCKKD